MVDGESTSTSYSDNNGSNDQDHDFECNICFELAQDPIVTLCGHLFCWPCLYRWLHHHSHSQECPVCKALVQDEKLVPLYGRGKNQTDPRTKRYPGMRIPNRPSGQRPETASPSHPHPPQGGGDAAASNFFNYGIGLMGGFMPMATTRIGNFSFGVGGLLPSLFNFQFHGFPDATLYGNAPGYPYGGYHNGFRGVPQEGNNNNNQQPMARGGDLNQSDAFLRNLALIIGISLILFLCW
uniref:E3 ubiquitin-protein ligase RMA n=1 Tax=Noccaea caerulescens TaxID=107243 RepID=A0A1J3CKF9_NOCCA